MNYCWHQPVFGSSNFSSFSCKLGTCSTECTFFSLSLYDVTCFWFITFCYRSTVELQQ